MKYTQDHIGVFHYIYFTSNYILLQFNFISEISDEGFVNGDGLFIFWGKKNPTTN